MHGAFGQSSTGSSERLLGGDEIILLEDLGRSEFFVETLSPRLALKLWLVLMGGGDRLEASLYELSIFIRKLTDCA